MKGLRIKGNHGFTLLEILIVLAVLAILSVSVIPTMTGFFSSKSENFKIFTSGLKIY